MHPVPVSRIKPMWSEPKAPYWTNSFVTCPNCGRHLTEEPLNLRKHKRSLGCKQKTIRRAMQEQNFRELQPSHPISHLIFSSKKLYQSIVRDKYDTMYLPEPVLAYASTIGVVLSRAMYSHVEVVYKDTEYLVQLEQFCSLSAEQQTEYLDSMQAIYELWSEQYNKEIPF